MSKREFFEIQADRKVRLSTGERVGIYQWGFIVVQPLSRVWLFETPWTAARQASLSFALSQSLLKLVSIESVMPPNHLILCHLLLLLPSIFPSIRGFSNIFIAIFNTVKTAEQCLQCSEGENTWLKSIVPCHLDIQVPRCIHCSVWKHSGRRTLLKKHF